MNNANLQRDQFHVNSTGDDAEITWPTEGSFGNSLAADTLVTVQSSYAFVRSEKASCVVTATNARTIGVYLKEPVTDDTPYRVKAHFQGDIGTTYVTVGYGPTAPTGAADVIEHVIAFPVGAEFDEVIKMPVLDDTHPDFGKPLFFGLTVAENSATTPCVGVLSVQNMSTASPQYASSTS